MESRVIGDMPASEVAKFLEACGDARLAAELRALGSNDSLRDLISSGRWNPHPWGHTEFQCAYLGPGPYPDGWGYLSDARSIDPDTALAGSRLKITLDKLRVYRYPGGGRHQILFDFGANHQSDPSNSTPVHFSQTYIAQDGEGAGISGYPIFDGLSVSPGSIDLSYTITNVANVSDEALLSFLNTDVFNTGLGFINAINPALPVVTSYAVAVGKMFLSRHENVVIHRVDLGLDLSNISTRPKLREGSYIVVQAPEGDIKWNLWVWDPGLGRVRWYNNNGILKYNYVIFSISRVNE